MKKSEIELPEYRQVVSLIPGGTMQFLDLGFDLRQLPRLKTEFLELEAPAGLDKVNI